MQDRVSQYPGRVKLTPVDGGDPVLYDMEWADNPTVTGTALNKTNLLQDTTAGALGLDSSATVNDAFVGVLKKLGLTPVYLTVTVGGKTPKAGILINGVTNADGSQLITDGQNSKYLCFSESVNVTASVSGYEDIGNKSVSGSAADVGILNLTLSINAPSGQTKVYTSSKTIKFSPYASNLDVCCVGGGGGGGGSTSSGLEFPDRYKEFAAKGGGGGGGRLVNQLNVDFSPNVEYRLVVGSGGAGRTSASGTGHAMDGGTGGTTSISALGITASGGGGGKGGNAYAGSQNGSGGSGNGNGGAGTSTSNAKGKNSTDGYILNSTSLGAAGGGGGAGYNTNSTAATIGGEPYGGNGAYYASWSSGKESEIQQATSGTKYGGGGGGGFSRFYGIDSGTANYQYASGASGAKGVIYLRWGVSLT